jgi:mono/diheme cytochrome c family protein
MTGIGRLTRTTAAAFITLLAACGPPAEPVTGPGAAAEVVITPEMIAEGRAVFAGPGLCTVCHGPQARGGSLGPNLTNNEWIWVDPSQNVHAQVARIVREGIETPRQYPAPMPPMGGGTLTAAQVNAVAAYVVSLNP